MSFRRLVRGESRSSWPLTIETRQDPRDSFEASASRRAHVSPVRAPRRRKYSLPAKPSERIVSKRCLKFVADHTI